LWVEVGRHFVRAWRAFFTRLENLHGLKRNSPIHLWLLHYLFLSSINDDCARFQTEWNNKSVNGTEGHGQSPADMRFHGQTTKGTYTTLEDDCQDISVEDIVRFYGVKGREKEMPVGMTGAGTAAEDLDATITAFEEGLDLDEEEDVTAEEWS
jgi:hypothetical protein